MACASQSLIVFSGNNRSFPSRHVSLTRMGFRRTSSENQHFSVRASPQEPALPLRKEISKLILERLAEKRTEAVRTHSSSKRDSASAQTNTESPVCTAESKISSGGRDTLTKHGKKMSALTTSWSLISIAAIASLLLQVEPAISEGGRRYQQIFHPPTGLCVVKRSLMEPLELGPCAESENWYYTPQKTLTIKGSYLCLQANGAGEPATLGVICTDSRSQWEPISESHLSTTLANGESMCLDVDATNTIITNPCYRKSEDQGYESASQWFEIASTTRDRLK